MWKWFAFALAWLIVIILTYVLPLGWRIQVSGRYSSALSQNQESSAGTGELDFWGNLNAAARSSGVAGGATGRRRWSGWMGKQA